MRRPRLTRVPEDQVPGYRITQKLINVLRGVKDYGALDTAQIQALYFPAAVASGYQSRSLYCLQTWFHAGFLWREELPIRLGEGRRPLVYFLDRKGAALLAELDGEDFDESVWLYQHGSAGEGFLAHLLATNQVRISFELAARAQGWRIRQWIDDRRLKSDQMKDYVTLSGPRGGKQRAAVVPDGFFTLDTGQGGYLYHQFLETDMGTVTTEASVWGKRDWSRKVAAYLEYHRSGQFTVRYHAKSFRVLTVTTSEKRLQHLKGATERAGGKHQFWFTTFQALTPQSALTEPIWREAGREEERRLTW